MSDGILCEMCERECYVCNGTGKIPVCVEGCGDIITAVTAYVMCDACNGTGVLPIFRG